eukprot:m.22980 g.22980  ORF g.22980 m.22980 type:complete len:475 (+) comp7012_c0_seq2:60-1484(+)
MALSTTRAALGMSRMMRSNFQSVGPSWSRLPAMKRHEHSLTSDELPEQSPELQPDSVETAQRIEKSGAEAQPVMFEDVMSAHFRIRDGIAATRLYKSQAMSKLLNANIYFKCEHSHPTGSFKERGARNALLLLTEEEKKKGVVAASAGNHGLGLAFHGAELGIPVTVVMPKYAPITKQHNCRNYQAEVILEGDYVTDARTYAMNLAEESGRRYINGYDDKEIIAGAGTVGIEILDTLPSCAAIVVPAGGCGLIAGISLAVKTLRPDVEVIGVEPEKLASFTAALKAGKPVNVPGQYTLADGLNVSQVGSNAFEVCRNRVDRTVLVKESSIALSMLRLIELEKAIVEGAGATGLAAMLEGLLPDLEGKDIVFPLCGGNVDIPLLGRVLDRALVDDQRLVRFTATVTDRPGGLASLINLLEQQRVSVKDITHDRARRTSQNLSMVNVTAVVECEDARHAAALFEALEKQDFEVEVR